MDDNEIETFLNSSLIQYQRLTGVVAPLIESILKNEAVEFLNVTYRTKTAEAIREKIVRKGYDDIVEQMTDVSGVRIITFLDSQVRKISDLIRETFEIDKKNSLDRGQILGDDRVGYRSIHFVCSLGPKRRDIMEYKDIDSLKFEIQVRTVLQHAWAELTHDRSYKFGGTLPSDIQRKLNLYSGMLEIADTAFDEIANSIDEYRRKLQTEQQSKFRSEPLNSISIDQFFQRVSKKYSLAFDTSVINNLSIKELEIFGLNNLGDIENLISEEVIESALKKGGPASKIGFLRRLMMYHDIDRYMKDKDLAWGWLSDESKHLLVRKYGEEKLKSLFPTNARASS